MMTTFRQLVTGVIFLGFVGLSLASTVHVVRQGLPRPFEMEQVDLTEWLTTRDMRHQGRSMRRRIVAQFERDFAAGVDWNSQLAELGSAERQRFSDNFANLTRVWLHGMSEGYLRASEEDRSGYLQRQRTRIRAWQMLDQPQPTQATRRGRRTQTKQLAERLPELFARAEPGELERVRMFLKMLEVDSIQRAFDPSATGGLPR